jgi:hypothetical protein
MGLDDEGLVLVLLLETLILDVVLIWLSVDVRVRHVLTEDREEVFL